MIEILELEAIYGYEFTLVDDQIHYHCLAEHPNFHEIKPRLDYIKAHRPDAYRFLKHRLIPDTWPLIFWDAAQAAAQSARQHEILGHPDFASQEWQRFARLFAQSMQSAGALDPCIPWDVWIRSFSPLPDPIECIPTGDVEITSPPPEPSEWIAPDSG